MSIADHEPLSTEKQALAQVFPLPLSTFEHFMFLDDRPDHPMSCEFQIWLRGQVDRAAFESAVASVVPRHPLFRSRVERSGKDAYSWVLTDQLPKVQWIEEGQPFGENTDSAIDLHVGTGLRVWVRQGPELAEVLLVFHHASADALGTIAFIGDLLAAYAMPFPQGASITPRQIDPARLLVRGLAGLDGRSTWRKILDVFVGAREGAKFFLQAPRPLKPPIGSDVVRPAGPRPSFVTQTCRPETVSTLRRMASERGATLNDVLMRDLFVVLRDWNTSQGEAPGRRRLRVLMPQNLRERDDSTMPAANVISFAFVTRRANLCDRPDELLDSISEETEAVRRGKLSLYFLGGLQSVISAGALPRVLGGKMCFATAVLTNLGRVRRHLETVFPIENDRLVIGNLQLENIHAVPPLRSGTHAAFAVTNNGDSLDISLRVDYRSFTPHDAQTLLDQFIRQLQTTAQRAAV